MLRHEVFRDRITWVGLQEDSKEIDRLVTKFRSMQPAKGTPGPSPQATPPRKSMPMFMPEHARQLAGPSASSPQVVFPHVSIYSCRAVDQDT